MITAELILKRITVSMNQGSDENTDFVDYDEDLDSDLDEDEDDLMK